MGAHPGLRDGDVDQELLARNEYLAAENRIMKAQLKGRLKLRAESPGEGQRPAVSSGYGPPREGPVRCRERLGGLLRHYN